MTEPSHLRLIVDNTRKRRQSSIPQAQIARAIRAARDHAGPNWRVELEVDGNVVRIFEGEAPSSAPVGRGIGVVP
jgi:hypothetical protein